MHFIQCTAFKPKLINTYTKTSLSFSENIQKEVKENSGDDNGKLPSCPVCDKHITKAATEYDIYQPSKMFRDGIEQLSRLLERGASN